MAKFQFRLQTVLDLRRGERDRRREDLAQALAAEQILMDRRRQLEADAALMTEHARGASQPGEVRVESLLDSVRYGLILAAQRQTLVDQLARVVQEIEVRRQRLVEADRQVKALELLHNRRLDEHQQREALIEVRQLDEAAARTHERRSD
jgi:flagellar FliJ protein